MVAQKMNPGADCIGDRCSTECCCSQAAPGQEFSAAKVRELFGQEQVRQRSKEQEERSAKILTPREQHQVTHDPSPEHSGEGQEPLEERPEKPSPSRASCLCFSGEPFKQSRGTTAKSSGSRSGSVSQGPKDKRAAQQRLWEQQTEADAAARYKPARAPRDCQKQDHLQRPKEPFEFGFSNAKESVLTEGLSTKQWVVGTAEEQRVTDEKTNQEEPDEANRGVQSAETATAPGNSQDGQPQNGIQEVAFCDRPTKVAGNLPRDGGSGVRSEHVPVFGDFGGVGGMGWVGVHGAAIQFE